jgi:endoribonuclease Dicer
MTRIIDHARDYQVQLYQMALERNIVTVLGTGTGKTLISVLLLKDMSIRESMRPHPRKALFLVNQVPLVTQQAAVISANCNLNVVQFYGEMGVDYWDAAKWKQHIDGAHVIVMTSQIFLNLLLHAYVHVKDAYTLCVLTMTGSFTCGYSTRRITPLAATLTA